MTNSELTGQSIRIPIYMMISGPLERNCKRDLEIKSLILGLKSGINEEGRERPNLWLGSGACPRLTEDSL